MSSKYRKKCCRCSTLIAAALNRNNFIVKSCEKRNVLIHRWWKDYYTNLRFRYHRIFAITKRWNRQFHFNFLVALQCSSNKS